MMRIDDDYDEDVRIMHEAPAPLKTVREKKVKAEKYDEEEKIELIYAGVFFPILSNLSWIDVVKFSLLEKINADHANSHLTLTQFGLL